MKKIFTMTLFLMCILSCSKMNQSKMTLAFPVKKIEIDPHRMEDIYSMTVNTQIHSSLLRYLGDGQIEPSIAKSWTISNDGLIYTFQIDASKTFSNGKLIQVIDVVKSLKRIFITEAAIGGDLASIKGVSRYRISKNPTDIEIFQKDNDKIIIVLEKRNSILLKQLATPDTAILNLDENYKIKQADITSGKYKILKHNEERIELELRETDLFTSKKPAINISFLLAAGNSLPAMALNGTLDMISLSSKAKELEMLKQKNWFEVLSGMSQENFLILNPEKVPLEWRRYFFTHFSTDDLVKNLKFNNKSPAYGYVPTLLQGSIKSQILIKNSNPIELGVLSMDITYMDFNGVEEIINYLKSCWSHPKLKLNFIKLGVDEYLKAIFTKKLQSSIMTKGLDYPDAMANLSYFKSDLKENFFLIEDVAIDEKIAECSVSMNKDDNCFVEVQEMIFNKKIVLPLYFGSDKLELWSERVNFVPSHPLGLQFLSFDQIEMK